MSRAQHETDLSPAGSPEFWCRQFEKWQQKIREMQQRCFQLSAETSVSETAELSDVLHETALHLMDAEKSLEAARTIALRQSLQEQRNARRS